MISFLRLTKSWPQLNYVIPHTLLSCGHTLGSRSYVLISHGHALLLFIQDVTSRAPYFAVWFGTKLPSCTHDVHGGISWPFDLLAGVSTTVESGLLHAG